VGLPLTQESAGSPRGCWHGTAVDTLCHTTRAETDNGGVTAQPKAAAVETLPIISL